jgi:hypothetical protein
MQLNGDYVKICKQFPEGCRVSFQFNTVVKGTGTVVGLLPSPSFSNYLISIRYDPESVVENRYLIEAYSVITVHLKTESSFFSGVAEYNVKKI